MFLINYRVEFCFLNQSVILCHLKENLFYSHEDLINILDFLSFYLFCILSTTHCVLFRAALFWRLSFKFEFLFQRREPSCYSLRRGPGVLPTRPPTHKPGRRSDPQHPRQTAGRAGHPSPQWGRTSADPGLVTGPGLGQRTASTPRMAARADTCCVCHTGVVVTGHAATPHHSWPTHHPRDRSRAASLNVSNFPQMFPPALQRTYWKNMFYSFVHKKDWKKCFISSPHTGN